MFSEEYYNAFFDVNYFIERLMLGDSVKEIARDWQICEVFLNQCIKDLNL